MKYYIVFFLVIGLSFAGATSLQETGGNQSLEAVILKSKPEETSPKTSSEDNQNTNEFNVIIESTDIDQTNYEELDLFPENVQNPTKQVLLEEPVNFNEFNIQDSSDNLDEIVAMQDSDYNYNDIINRDPNEIMDTAAGFVPIPIFKRRQRPRKQIAARRRFRKPNPYRRLYYFYPYYSYYRPSSLRFYY